MADAWDQFPDAPQADPWAHFPDAAPHPFKFDRAAFMQQEADKQRQNSVDSLREFGTDFWKSAGDTAATIATQVPLTIGAGLVGAVSAPFVGSEKAADIIKRIQSWGYQPHSDAGKKTADLVSRAVDKTEVPGRFITDITGSPLAGAATTTGLNALLLAADPGARAAAGSVARGGAESVANAASRIASRGKVAPNAAAPQNPAAVQAAQNYASTNGLNWNDLSAGVQEKLAQIAASSGDFTGIDPGAVARQARLEGMGIPATRGQVTRNLAQLTREENISKTNAGQGVRDINAEQDTALHGLLDTLRGQTGAKATTRAQIGESVQGAERGKAQVLLQEKGQAYAAAEAQGATAGPADIAPLQEWLKNPTNSRNAGYLKQAIEDYLPKGADGKPNGSQISINDLEEIRKEASANRGASGPAGFYAGEAIKVIDGILDNSGSDIYKTARAKHNAYMAEFDRQSRVAKLVDEKGYTSDRAVALEDTLDHIKKSSAEEIGTIKKSLLTGGNAETRAKGTQAWKDIQAGFIDFLKEKAAGRRSIAGENGQLEFNSAFRDAYAELKADGKIAAVFTPDQAATLDKIYQAVGDVRTKPSARIAGSDSIPRAMAMLESFGAKLASKANRVPGVGPMAVAGVSKLYELSKQGAEAKAATTTPLNELAAQYAGKSRRKATVGTKDQLPSAAIPLSGGTRQ